MLKPASHLVLNREMSRDNTTTSVSSYNNFHTPKLESSDTINRLFTSDSQSTDLDYKITEWLANEEASLDKSPISSFGTQQGIAIQQPSYNSDATINTLSGRHSKNEGVQPMQSNETLPVIGNTKLRSTNEIPSPFASIFKFGVFNIIQSKCIDDAFYENNNLVISAPTGSGKTVLMELGIIRALLNNGTDCKIIYMAPTKSLCSERAKDWENKFSPFGIECREFTGDTHFVSTAAIRKTTIISLLGYDSVTTPEKWDSMTRRWIDNRQLMQLISLFLIDEVHILNEKRGACLEACVSRMQTMDNNLRYIAVSATIPNLQDIATWLKAKPLSFSEEYRPIKLERFVYGYPHNDNMFLFDKKLDWKLLDIIQKHSNTKPVLIFCSTRKSAESSCDTLLKLMEKKRISSLCENGKKLGIKPKLKNKLLPGFAERGIVFHHAGLDPSDRSQIENMFLNREIRVIATTSTLAVGVNLPAHLVIIKSTQGYQNGSLSEYSDIDLLQMIGRAGRPGLDTSGTAVIMTTSQMERRYNSLISGITNLESRLHENLIEHLLSEICLGTISNISTALNWLYSTFLYVRLLKNPTNYKVHPTSVISTDNILKEICTKDLELLKEHNLIERDSNFSLNATPYGIIMDNYYIKFPTMVKILETENPTSVKDTLQLISECQQEMDMIRFNSGDRQFLNMLKNNPNIRFPLDKVVNVADKICMLVQCVLGDISLYNSGNTLLVMESANAIKDVSRIVRCLIDCSVQEKNSVKLRFALELYQSVQAKLWSTSPYVARQIDGIGPQHAKTLSQANLITMDQLKACESGRFEVILHRNPPFGTKIRKCIDLIPKFFLNVEQSPSKKRVPANSPHEFIDLHITIGLLNEKINKGKYGQPYYAQFWVEASEKNLLDFRRILISNLHRGRQKFDLHVEVISPNMAIFCHLSSENFVGVDVTKKIKPNVNPRSYITLAGDSNISNVKIKNNPLVVTENLTEYSMAELDAVFDNELDAIGLDTQTLKDLANIDTQSNTFKETSFQAPGLQPNNTNSVKRVSDLEDSKNPNIQKKPTSDELCRHRCKAKDICKHACCKLHINNSSLSDSQVGKKRNSNDIDDLLEIMVQKKAKPPAVEVVSAGTLKSSDKSIPKTIENAHTSNIGTKPDIPEVSNDIVGGSATQIKLQQDDDYFFDEFFDMDLTNCIDGMSNLGSQNSPMEVKGGVELSADFCMMTDVNGKGEFSDPCELLWQQAGEYVQKAFEKKSPQSKNISRSSESIGLSTHPINVPTYKEYREPMQPHNYAIQSPSLAEWVRDNVEIIYDE